MWFFGALVLVASGASLAEAQSCRSAAAQQCRDRIFQVIQQHTQDFTGGDANALCSTLRDNMACLLWQSANCQTHQEQQRSGEHILAAKNFLDRFCDFDGGWRNSRCYQYDEVSRCENVFNQRRSSDACNSYNRFKDCVKEVLQRRCNRNDEQSFPSFLVERARELAWTCSSTSGSNQNDRNRYDTPGSRYTNEQYGSNYDANNPNTRYGDNRYNSDRYNSDRYNSDRYGNDRYGNDRYNQRPSYLPNQNSPDDSYCLFKAQDQIRECDSNHQRRQYNARRYHADERIKESCCATIDYKSCLRNSLTNHCREYGHNTVESIVTQKVRDADNDCRQFDAYRCTSGAFRVGATAVVVTLLGLIVATVRVL